MKLLITTIITLVFSMPLAWACPDFPDPVWHSGTSWHGHESIKVKRAHGLEGVHHQVQFEDNSSFQFNHNKNCWTFIDQESKKLGCVKNKSQAVLADRDGKGKYGIIQVDGDHLYFFSINPDGSKNRSKPYFKFTKDEIRYSRTSSDPGSEFQNAHAVPQSATLSLEVIESGLTTGIYQSTKNLRWRSKGLNLGNPTEAQTLGFDMDAEAIVSTTGCGKVDRTALNQTSSTIRSVGGTSER